MKIDSYHRIITINGVKYAWTVNKGINAFTDIKYNNLKYIRIWEKETKKFLFEQKIPEHKEISAKLIKGIVNAKDDIEKLLVISEPCPFCNGELKEHPNPEWREDFFACYHDEDCFLCEGKAPMNFTLIKRNKIDSWNFRNSIPKL